MSANRHDLDTNIDIDAFICDIEERPAIWDARSEFYGDRVKKKEAWDELCLKHDPKFNDKNFQEKKGVAAQLQRKWKSLRDCFRREQTKQITGGRSSRRPYIYYHQLAFLLDDNYACGRTPPADQRHDTVEIKKLKKNKELTYNERNKTETDIFNKVTESLEYHKSSELDDEGDRNFALSLVPHLKHIPPELKLDVQADILMLLKKYKQCRRPPQNQPRINVSLSPFQRRWPHRFSYSSTSGRQSNSPAAAEVIQSDLSDDGSSVEEKSFPSVNRRSAGARRARRSSRRGAKHVAGVGLRTQTGTAVKHESQ